MPVCAVVGNPANTAYFYLFTTMRYAMTTAVSIPGLPLTLNERSLAPDVIRVKATFEEYLDIAETCPYPIQYINGEIVSMGQASLTHEALVGRLTTLLNNLFDDTNELMVFSSNIKLFIEATGDSLNADASVVRGKPNYLRLRSGRFSTATILNPEMVVEVLSGTTQQYDLGDKLNTYKQIVSLRQVLFVNQYKPEVISHVRSNTTGEWLTTTANALTESVDVLGSGITLASIYKKIQFGQE